MMMRREKVEAAGTAGLGRDRVDLSGCTFHASKQCLAPLPTFPSLSRCCVLVVQRLSGATSGSRERSAAGRPAREHEWVVCPLGGVLPSGLVGDDCFLADSRAAGTSVAAGFAAVPKC